MRDSDGTILIIGAGMSGLVAALLAKKRRPTADVVVVERSREAGGDYRGVDLDGFGHCDRAMRVIYETGITELDGLLHGILPEDEWHVLPGNTKDVVGLYWRGRLQTSCQYIDLRRLAADERGRCEHEILGRVGRVPAATPDSDAARYLDARFGPTVAAYLGRALEKLYLAPAASLHAYATHHPAMNRVILYEEERMGPVLRDEAMRAVIAWPEQRTFPLERQPAQAGLYPRRFGMSGVVDAAVAQLRRRGVRMLFERDVSALGIADGRIDEVHLDDGTCIERPELVISAAGLHGSLRMLRAGEPLHGAPRPPRSWMVFVRAAEPPDMHGLYHFFCYDERYRAFRVTSYANYCPGARNEVGFPVCVELWSPDEDAPAATARACRELREMGVVDDSSIVARAALAAPNLHAFCTSECVQHLRAVRDEVAERSPRNMVTVGPFVEDGTMLLYEVWRKMHASVAERLP